MGAALLIITLSLAIKLSQEHRSLSFLKPKPAILNFIQFHLYTIALTTKYHYVLERFQHAAIGNFAAVAYHLPADVSASQVIQYVTCDGSLQSLTK